MKRYRIRCTKLTTHGEYITEYEGSLEELTKHYGYVLYVGKQYENERGNKCINMAPKTVRSLVNNLNRAFDNAAENGYSGVWFERV